MGENFIKSKNTSVEPVVIQGDLPKTGEAAPAQQAQAPASQPAAAQNTVSPEAMEQATKSLREEIDRLNAELEKMRAAYREHDTMHQRTLADFDNYRRRVAIEKEVTTKLANEKLIKELLSTLDNYDRSLHLDVPPEARDFKVGMEIIYKNFMQVLKNNGLEAIDSDGAKFDPNYHEAVSHMDSDLPAETVVTTYQRGYRLGERVLRHAIVVVSNGSGAPATAPEAPSSPQADQLEANLNTESGQ